jgi:hypothetical protein
MFTKSRSVASTHTERSESQGDRDGCAHAVDRRQRHAAVEEWADAEGSDAVSDLVEGDHSPRPRRPRSRKLFLSESEGQRWKSRAAKACQAEGEDPECDIAVGHPYCVFERSYRAGSVKIVLAAGNVTSTIP